LQAHGQREVYSVPRLEDLPAFLKTLTKKGDLLITFGAGTITNAGPAFLEL